MRALFALLLAIAVAGSIPGQALAEAVLDDFFGNYVGGGLAERDDGSTEERDMDVAIAPYKQNGFTLSWVTVVRDEAGTRTGPGVKRRAVEEDFVPSPDQPGVYISAPEGGLFSTTELANPMAGDPFRWASLRNGALTVYSAGISEDGGSELQIYYRTLTEDGLDVSFVRLADEIAKIRVTGTLVKVE